MRLERVTTTNIGAALRLAVRADQEDLVASVAISLAEAYVHGEHAWPRLIYDGERPVGFLMAFLDMAWEPSKPDDVRSGLWRLAIAAGEQRRGYGRFAVEAVCAKIRADGGTRAYVSWEGRDGGPGPFYLGLGFRPTGEEWDGETVAVRELPPAGKGAPAEHTP